MRAIADSDTRNSAIKSSTCCAESFGRATINLAIDKANARLQPFRLALQELANGAPDILITNFGDVEFPDKVARRGAPVAAGHPAPQLQ